MTFPALFLSRSLVAAALWFEVISLISFLCCCFLTCIVVHKLQSGMLVGELCCSTEKFDGILMIYIGTSISLKDVIRIKKLNQEKGFQIHVVDHGTFPLSKQRKDQFGSLLPKS